MALVRNGKTLIATPRLRRVGSNTEKGFAAASDSSYSRFRLPRGTEEMRFLLGVLVGYSMRGKRNY